MKKILYLTLVIFAFITACNTGETKKEPVESPKNLYSWGTVLQLNNKSDLKPYLDKGWSAPEASHTWSNGKSSNIRMHISPPKAEQMELTCSVSPFLVPSKGLTQQKVGISINGISVGDFVITNPQKIKVTFSKNLIANSNEMNVGFSLPDAAVGKDMGVAGEGRMLGLAFYSITIKEL
jgi:hypothetical protein